MVEEAALKTMMTRVIAGVALVILGCGDGPPSSQRTTAVDTRYGWDRPLRG